MPQQEVFFERVTGEQRVEVLKTYDRNYAREAFGSMGEDAQRFLWTSLGIDENYETSELPARPGPDSEDFLWEELVDAAREDGSLFSFFVVNEIKGTAARSLFVSPDWPSAEAFALHRLPGEDSASK